MNDLQQHRGPDDGGLDDVKTSAGSLVLGHRRLSILDLSSAGRQPMENPDTGDKLVFNGEIYNYRELRTELESSGAIFRSRSDTEVILHAFQRWGTDCFARLRGMFAIAVFDRSKRRLVLARDPLGIKPLYHTTGTADFAFASELRGIGASGAVEPVLHRASVASLLAYGCVPEPGCIWKKVRMLARGTWASLDLGQPGSRQLGTPVSYWSFPEQAGHVSRGEARERVADLLRTAARRHLLSDVRVGLFLSSGLDSTAIAALCRSVHTEPLNTFTVGMPQLGADDEAAAAAVTAEALGTSHSTIHVSDSDAQAQVGHWLDCMDQPTIDGLNTYIISGAVRSHGIKVALSGLGGDELFGGYPNFSTVPRAKRFLSMTRWLPNAARGSALSILSMRAPHFQRQKIRDLAATAPSIENVYLRSRRVLGDRDIRMLGFDAEELGLSSEWLNEESHALLATGATGHDWTSVSNFESTFFMGNMLLRDSDVFGMSHGLEIRVPFLDTDLVDYVLSLPPSVRMTGESPSKPLLSDSLGALLPRHVMRLPKRGFLLGQTEWMRGPLREELEAYLAVAASSGVVDGRTARGVYDQFLSEPRDGAWSRAWALCILGGWMGRRSDAVNVG